MKIKLSTGRKVVNSLKNDAKYKASKEAMKGLRKTATKSQRANMAKINNGMMKVGYAKEAVTGHVKANKGKYIAGGAVAGAAMVGGAVKKRQEDKKFKNRAKKFIGVR